MRVLSAAIAATLALLGPAGAQSFDTPQAVIEALYAPHIADEITDDFAALQSNKLSALYEAKLKSDGYFDFDPVIVAQDWDLSDLAIDQVDVEGDTATAHVSFDNFGTRTELDYFLVNEDGWKIDNIVSEGEPSFSLVEMLSATE